MESKKQKNIERLEKALPEHFVDSVRASNESHLKDMIVTLSQEIENIDDYQPQRVTLKEIRELFEMNYITAALRTSNWNVAHASEYIGVTRSTFYSLMDKYNIPHDKE